MAGGFPNSLMRFQSPQSSSNERIPCPVPQDADSPRENEELRLKASVLQTTPAAMACLRKARRDGEAKREGVLADMSDPSRYTRVLIRRAAAGQVEHRSRGEGIFPRAEPGNHGGDLLDGDETATRDLREHVIDEFLGHLLQYPRFRGNRGHAVHGDVVTRELLAETLRQCDHRR